MKLLPKFDFPCKSDEVLEEKQLRRGLLWRQVDVLVHDLLPLTVGVEGHHSYALVMGNGQLDVGPLVEWKED